jgi:hypothetical protein
MRFVRPVSLRISSSYLVSTTPEFSPLKGNLIYVLEFQLFRLLPKHSFTIDATFPHALIIIKRTTSFHIVCVIWRPTDRVIHR